jgi:ATP-dependent helicase/nuclease subunit B
MSVPVLPQIRAETEVRNGRRTGDGHPLLPSRLLLQDGTDNAAGRLLSFYQDTTPSERPGTAALPGPRASPPALRVVSFPGDLKPGSARCVLDDPPKPDPKVALPDSMSVTSFRAYLDCPYRYYLRYVLRLKSVTDAAREMDSLHFGNVMHEVLQGFPIVLKGGRGSASSIRDCLLTLLDEKLRKRFGALSPAMHLQAGVMRRRLEAFAERQAEWSAKGYLVLHSELDVTADDRTRRLDVDGIPMHIHGRIDRIDVRDDGSEAVIFDYKTSGHAVKPDDAHVDGETWVDLQLPLYRHLIEGLPGLPATRRLGYINLPGDVGTTNLSIAEWTEEDLAGADEAAREVVRGIRKRVFWPPRRLPENWADDFADICRSTRFVALPGGEEESDEADA